MAVQMVDTTELVRGMVDKYTAHSPQPILLFVDLEGVNLCRHGSLDILQLYSPSIDIVHIVDVYKLQKDAFDTTAKDNKSLRTLLESNEVPKVFFDVRTDSDALFSHFKVGLRGIIDLQLLEFVTRNRPDPYLRGLAKCIQQSISMSWTERQTFDRVKSEGKKLFDPVLGRGYEIFQKRPLDPRIVDYCAQDVRVLPQILQNYARKISPRLAGQLQEATLERVRWSQRPGIIVKGQHMAIGPNISRNRTGTMPALVFPMDLVCSTRLEAMCKITPPTVVTTVEPVLAKKSSTTETVGDTFTSKLVALSLTNERSVVNWGYGSRPFDDIFESRTFDDDYDDYNDLADDPEYDDLWCD